MLKKTTFLVAAIFLLLFITGAAQQNGKGVNSQVIFATNEWSPADPGVFKTTLGNPNGGTKLRTLSADEEIYAMTWIKGNSDEGTIYASRYWDIDPDYAWSEFGTIDPTTGSFNVINADAPSYCGLAENPLTGIVYATTWRLSGGSYFGTVDLETGNFNYISTLPGNDHWDINYTIAIDNSGVCYAQAFYLTYLFTIDLTTGVLDTMVRHGFYSTHVNNLSIDRETNELYIGARGFFQLYDGYWDTPFSAFFSIDKVSGKFTQLGTPPQWYQAFTIMGGDGLSNQPAAVTNLTVTPDPAGNLSAALSWTNPVQTFNGLPLTDLIAVNVYQNDTLIHTITNPVIGGNENFTATVTTSGFYTYKVVGVAALGGTGSVNSAKVYIGIDVPAAPGNVTLVKNGAAAQLFWTAPTAGLNGAYFEPTGMVYDVYRFPGNIQVSENQTSVMFVENITYPNQHYYKVVAKNASGTGGSANSNSISFCDAISYPWNEGFENSEGIFSACYQQEHVAGNMDWGIVKYSELLLPVMPHSGTYKAVFMPNVGTKTKLILPQLNLTSLDNPVLTFWHTQRAWGSRQDILRIWYKNAADGDWILLKEYETEVFDWTESKIALPNKSANYYIAFEGEGDFGEGIHLDDITIAEASNEIDAAALKLFGSLTPMVGEPFLYKILVQNIGDIPLTDYTVKLIDQNNNVLAAHNTGADIDSYQTAYIDIIYTPVTAGQLSLRAVIEVDGDTNPDNDTTPVFEVDIQSAANIFTGKVGSGTNGMPLGTPSGEIPFDFYWETTCGQVIYFEHEIISRAGAITQLEYFYDFYSDIPSERVQIWMANTTQSRLDAWIPLEEFVLVFDGNIKMLASENNLAITLDNPFIYDGQNLVIMTKRPLGESYWDPQTFYVTTTPEFLNRTRKFRGLDHDFNFEWNQQGTGLNFHPNIVMNIALEGATLNGTITHDGTAPVEGATVEIIGQSNLTRTTDAAGNYTFDFLAAGTYQVKASKLGHYDATSESITVVVDNEYVVDLTIPYLPTYTVSGKVTGNDAPDGLEEVEVKLSGYNTYIATTDISGNYSIPNVYGTHIYNISASKTGYQTYYSTVSVNNVVTHNITLDEIAYPVGRVHAEELSNDDVLVTWTVPGTFGERTYILDDGSAEEAFYVNPDANVSLGNLFEVAETGELISIDLFGYEHPQGTNQYVTIDIYNAAQELVGSSDPFIIPADKWINVQLDHIPYTDIFYVMVHWNMLSDITNMIGFDAQGPNKAMYYNNLFDWWSYLDQIIYMPGVFLIRANAEIHGKKVSYGYELPKEVEISPAIKNHESLPTKQTIENTGVASVKRGTVVAPECIKPEIRTLTNYQIYRLKEYQPESEWSLLADDVTETSFTDDSYESLPAGIYQYAVKAKYTGSVISAARLSNKLFHKMEGIYQINISSNSGEPVTGAIVRMTNQDGNPAHDYTKTSDATGIVIIPNLWMGTYDLKIELEGHEGYTANDIVIWESGLSHTVQLIEMIPIPRGLEIDPNHADLSALFGWNKFQTFFDDAESHENFIISNIGGYTLYDFNGSKTWSIPHDYPHIFEPQAFIVFNPSATNPPLNDWWYRPYSGNKYLASFAPVEGESDSWLILPKLRITEGMKFSFWARSIIDASPERMKILISTTGANAPDDFKLISEGNYMTVPEEWTYYSYDLSSFGNREVYLAINCVSTESTRCLLVDDISVDLTGKSSNRSLLGYTVYLDGEEVAANVQSTDYIFTNLTEGKHTAGVRAVYSSGSSNIATKDFNVNPVGVNDIEKNGVTIFPNPSNGIVNIAVAEKSHITVFDIAGKIIDKFSIAANSAVKFTQSSGVYIIQVECNNVISRHKLVITK